MIPEPYVATLQVIEALDQLGVPYFIGGSLASSVYGVARMTLDADVIADLRMEHAEPLARALEGTFHVSILGIRDAISHRSSFNVIHRESIFKVDVFVLKKRLFDLSQLARRSLEVIVTDPERSAFLATAEDMVLAKLEWYRMGNEVSDRQWGDVLGMLKAQKGRLDLNYLREWATKLGIDDLLQRALREADIITDDKTQ